MQWSPTRGIDFCTSRRTQGLERCGSAKSWPGKVMRSGFESVELAWATEKGIGGSAKVVDITVKVGRSGSGALGSSEGRPPVWGPEGRPVLGSERSENRRRSLCDGEKVIVVVVEVRGGGGGGGRSVKGSVAADLREGVAGGRRGVSKARLVT